MKVKVILIVILILVILLIYRNWFLAKEIIGGDWPYIYHENLQDFSLFPPAWSAAHGNGMGGIISAYYLDQYLYSTIFIFTNLLKLPWIIVYKIFWFGLFLLLSVLSSGYLVKTFLPKGKLWQKLLSILIYTANTYILMVVDGGQMGVALAYSLAPFVLARFIKIINSSNFSSSSFQFSVFSFQFSLMAGLVLAVQIMFDPRIAYLTLIMAILYLVFHLNRKILIRSMLYVLIIPVGIAVLLHAYWVLPLIIFRTNPVPQNFGNTEGFRFFSFADFSQALALLHPNWPENIFGKVYFMRPEFLLIPLLAFSSLLFLRSPIATLSDCYIVKKGKNNNLTMEQFNNGTILFFAFIGLLGAFLAKGANQPLGELNIWIYENFPGMSLFRDPTKYYILIALSYSILIPYSLEQIYDWIKSKVNPPAGGQKSKDAIRQLADRYSRQMSGLQIKIKKYLPNLFLLLTTCYFLLLVKPAWAGELKGTFASHTVPQEYIDIKNFLANEPGFFRVLWVPKRLRFSFSLQTHPALEATVLFGINDPDELIPVLTKSSTQNYLSQLGIKYVIIPYDSFSEYFLEDQKYSQAKRKKIEEELDNIPWLRKVLSGKITVYETVNYLDRFRLEKQGQVSYEMINMDEYKLSVSTLTDNSLIFTENFSPWWVAKTDQTIIPVVQTEHKLNSFALAKGDYQVKIYYQPADYYKYGRIISLATLILILIILVKFKKHEI